MKLFLIMSLTLSSLTFAAGSKFEAQKAKRLKMLDNVIVNLNKSKSCIKAAKNKDALKLCGKDRKEMRSAMKAKRIERKKLKKESKEKI